MQFTFGGFRPENDPDQKHWGYDRLKPLLVGYSSKASDLRNYASPRHDQGHSGSCVAQSIIKALELKRIQRYAQQAATGGASPGDAIITGQMQHVDLSRLALYYLARELMDPQETDKDEGTIISIAADALRRFGVCREAAKDANDRSYWPFDLNLLYTAPGWMQMREAYVHKISAWYKIYSTGNDRVDDVIEVLASGNPVVYGTKVGSNFQNYDGTPIRLPTDVSGGHATVLEGWNPTGGYFWGENSWGEDWGPDNGFYKMDPEVIASSISSDFIVMVGGWEPWIQR